MKHCWVATDNQGYSMQCIRCGIEITHPALTGDLQDAKRWDEQIDAECTTPCPGTCEYREEIECGK